MPETATPSGEGTKTSILQFLKSKPKTVTAILTLVVTTLGTYGIDISFISIRNGPEFWRYADGVYQPIEPEDQAQGDTVLRIDWEGEGRKIKSLDLYKVSNEKVDFVKKVQKPQPQPELPPPPPPEEPELPDTPFGG